MLHEWTFIQNTSIIKIEAVFRLMEYSLFCIKNHPQWGMGVKKIAVQ